MSDADVAVGGPPVAAVPADTEAVVSHRYEQTREWLAERRSHFARTGEVPGHNSSGYLIGCRCRICREAHRDTNAASQDRENERRKQERRLRRDPNADFNP